MSARSCRPSSDNMKKTIPRHSRGIVIERPLRSCFANNNTHRLSPVGIAASYTLGGKVRPPTLTLTEETSRPVMDSMASFTASCTALPISGMVCP